VWLAWIVVLVVGWGGRSLGAVRDHYEMVTHACGAVESFVPIENVIVVAFAPGTAPTANFDLASAEGFLVRTTPQETARDGIAVYALPPGEDLEGAMERVAARDEVQAVMPALVPEDGARAVLLDPGSFTVTIDAQTVEERQAMIARLHDQHGFEAEPTLPVSPGMGGMKPQERPEPPPNLLKVWVPRGDDLFDAMAAASDIDGVLGVGVGDVKSALSEHNDSYLIDGAYRTDWYVLRTSDGGKLVEVRHDYLPVDSLLVVEFERRPSADELAGLLEDYDLRYADPEVPEYDEVPEELAGRIAVLATDGDSRQVCERLRVAPGSLVRGAMPGLRRPFDELETVSYLRPRDIIVEFTPEVELLQIRLAIQERGLEMTAHRFDDDLELTLVDAALPPDAELFATLRGLRSNLKVLNARPIEVASDNEVQLVAGHRFERREPDLTYVDQDGDTVRLFANPRLVILTFADGTTAGDQGAVAGRLGLRLIGVRQNLNLRDPHVVYEVPAGRTSWDVVDAARAALPELEALVGAAAVMYDPGVQAAVYPPQGWLRVAFEPKSQQAEIDAILAEYALEPPFDPDLPVAQDPYLDMRGNFWNFYVSRRIPLVAEPGRDIGPILTALNREDAVVWAHPYSLTPALDRGSRLVFQNTGGGWYSHDHLDGGLDMLIHLMRTTRPAVVEGFAQREGIQLEDGRLPVIIEPRPDTDILDVELALEATDVEVTANDGTRIYGFANLATLPEVADMPGVGMIRCKESSVGRP
jgi:hypothetical protein